MFDGSTAVGNSLFRYGLGTSFGGSETTLLAGLAGANSNGTSGAQLLSSRLYEAPSATFADLHWQASPTWQFEGSALSNFNDVTRFSLGTRYRLALPGLGKASNGGAKLSSPQRPVVAAVPCGKSGGGRRRRWVSVQHRDWA